MTWRQELVIANIEAAVANLRSELMRGVNDFVERSATIVLLERVRKQATDAVRAAR